MNWSSQTFDVTTCSYGVEFVLMCGIGEGSEKGGVDGEGGGCWRAVGGMGLRGVALGWRYGGSWGNERGKGGLSR